MVSLEQNKIADITNTISSQDIRHVLETNKKAKENLKTLEKNLQTVKRGVSSTADHVAQVVGSDARFRKTVTTSLVKSLTFRKRIAEEILAYLLLEGEENRH